MRVNRWCFPFLVHSLLALREEGDELTTQDIIPNSQSVFALLLHDPAKMEVSFVSHNTYATLLGCQPFTPFTDKGKVSYSYSSVEK